MQHHQMMHLALAIVYLLTSMTFLFEAAYTHAGCAVTVAGIYGLFVWQGRHHDADD